MPTNDIVVAAFTEMAAGYEQTVDRELSQFWGVGYREFVARFTGPVRLGAHARVLDIGTGMAVVPCALLEHAGWDGPAVGVDITPEMLARARQRLTQRAGGAQRIRLVCGSGMVLPFRDAAFDVVTCALATHHMHVPTLLGEIHRVLSPGGQLLIADVGLADFWATRAGRLWIRGLAAAYSLTQGQKRVQAELDAIGNMFAPDRWRDMLLTAGFAQVSMEVLPAKRRWCPPGLLMQACSPAQAGQVTE